MGWFQRLFGGGEAAAPPSGPFLVELVQGKLTAKVFVHDMPDGPRSLPCWTYVTDGFLPLGQKEFVFTLVRGQGDNAANPPTDPLKFLTQIFSFAEQKQFVDVGGVTCFKPREGGFLGLTGMIGFTYARPESLPGVEMPPEGRCLQAILLVPGEAEFVQGGGAYRVLSRLGRATTYYPHPPWSAPHRAPMLTPDEFRDSLLGKMPLAHICGVFLRMFLRTPATLPPAGEVGDAPLGDRFTLRIQRSQAAKLREFLSKLAARSEGAFTLTLDADPEANVRLTWRLGDTGLNTITPATGDASCLTGGFLAVVYGPSIADGGRIVEDGFAVTLCPDSWSRLHHALMNGEPVELPATQDHIGLSVEWLADESAATSAPATASDDSRFRLDLIQLYQPDEVLRQRVQAIDAVARFVKQVEAIGATFWDGQPVGKPQRILIAAAIKPGGHLRVWVDVPAGLGAEEAARNFATRLEQLSPPVVQNGPVAFAMRASLWGGGNDEWPMFPNEWGAAAAAAGGQLLVPEGILERIWPG